MTLTPSPTGAPSHAVLAHRLNSAVAHLTRAPFSSTLPTAEQTSPPEAIPHDDLLKKTLMALGLTGSERVLEVGSRTGYETALLSRLAGEVFSLAPNPELAAERAALLGTAGCSNVKVVVGPGQDGWPAGAPYAAIFVAGGATQIPASLLDQLEAEGRLVIPLGDASGQLFELVRRHQDGCISETLASCHLAMLPWASRRPSSFPWRKED